MMEFRLAGKGDLEEICRVVRAAVAYLKAHDIDIFYLVIVACLDFDLISGVEVNQAVLCNYLGNIITGNRKHSICCNRAIICYTYIRGSCTHIYKSKV